MATRPPIVFVEPFEVSVIPETWKFPVKFYMETVWNDLNGAKRLNDWNGWNGLSP